MRIRVDTFSNLNSSDGNDWIGFLIADAIENNLKTLPRVKVIPSKLNDGAGDVAAMNKEPLAPISSPENVADFVVGGDFKKEGNTIVINAIWFKQDGSMPAGGESLVSTFRDLYSDLDNLTISLGEYLMVECSDEHFARMQIKPTDSLDATKIYGMALAASSRSNMRKGLLEKALSFDADYSDALMKLGILLYQTGSFREAINTFTRLEKIQSDYPGLYYNLGLSYRGDRQSFEALKMYRKALETNPEDPDTWNNLGVVYYSAGMLDEAKQAFSRALSADPDDLNARANLALMLSIQNDPLSDSEVETSYFMELRNHIDAGAALYMAGRYWAAIEEFEKALKLQPNNFKANNNIALAYMKVGESEKARRYFERALLANPTARDVRKALEAFEDIDKDDNSGAEDDDILTAHLESRAKRALGKVYLSRESYDEAAGAFNEALALVPSDVESLSGLGSAHFGLSQYADAQNDYRLALELEPHNEFVKKKLAEMDFILSETNENSAAAAGGHNSTWAEIEARASYVRGNALYESSRYDEAAEEYRKTLELAPKFIEAYNNLAGAYIALERYEEARTTLKKARLLNPDNVAILRNLDTIEANTDGALRDTVGQFEMLPVDHVIERKKETAEDISQSTPG